MKVLIWFLCFFANVLITTLIKQSGVILGAIPTMILYGVTIWLARSLCKLWDNHQENKALENALDQLVSNPKSQSIEENNHDCEQQVEIDFSSLPVPTSGWRCSCGRPHPKYESSCICGKPKSNNVSSTQSNESIAETAVNPSETDKVIFCRKCGEKLIENGTFCSKCGTEIVKEL